MKILILEDDAPIAELYKKILKPDGFTCDIANNLTEATNLLSENTYDCHLIDLNLKGDTNTGWDIVSKGYKPIMIISAMHFNNFEFSADVTWLSKPIDYRSFANEIHKCINKQNNANAATG